MTELLPILRSPIIQGGFGRNLTSTEVRDLRSRGIRCSEGWVVVRYASDIPDVGRLYKPAPLGGYNDAKIRVGRSSTYRVKPRLDERWSDERIRRENEAADA